MEATLIAGTNASWKSESSMYSRTRTSRKSLVEQFAEFNMGVSAEVKAELQAEVTFPIKFIPISLSGSLEFDFQMNAGVTASSKMVNDWEHEDEKSFEHTVSITYGGHKEIGQPDVVVYKEVWKIGASEFKRAYKSANRDDFEKMENEVHDIKFALAVDFQWHQIQEKGRSKILECCAVIDFHYTDEVMETPWLTEGNPSQTFDSKWRFDGKNIINASGDYLRTASKIENLSMVVATPYDKSRPAKDYRWDFMQDDSLRNGYGNCIKRRSPFFFSTTDTFITVQCGSGSTKFNLVAEGKAGEGEMFSDVRGHNTATSSVVDPLSG